MKRTFAILLTMALAVLCINGALGEQKVQLPESSYSITIPDGMEYDGPGEPPDEAAFAWVSAKLGLEIDFFLYSNEKGVSLQYLAEELSRTDENIEEISINRINGLDMIVYRVTDPTDPPLQGMKCIGYVLEDGNRLQMICFWYANQEAADLTAAVITSITDKD